MDGQRWKDSGESVKVCSTKLLPKPSEIALDPKARGVREEERLIDNHGEVVSDNFRFSMSAHTLTYTMDNETNIHALPASNSAPVSL